MSNPNNEGNSRRRFLINTLAASSTLFLAGCDKLSHSQWFPKVLDSAASVNHHVQRFLSAKDSMAREFSEADLSPHFKSNGTHHPNTSEYHRLAKNHFADYRLEVTGLVERPTALSLADLRKLPSRTQITRHDCVEGWSCIGKWKGARLSALLEQVKPRSEARFVICHCFDSLAGSRYYESIDFEDAFHPQTILAYEFNDKILPIPHGAPIRLRVERQLGYKMAKYIKRIELVENYADIGRGKGGYWEDRGYAWYAGI